VHDFRRLDVYARALRFTRKVRLTTALFPRDELFSLTSQFRRASDSVVLNIAEGAGNKSKREFARFLGYAIRSGFECGGCADIAKTQDYIDEAEYETLVAEGQEIIAMLVGLQRAVLRGIEP